MRSATTGTVSGCLVWLLVFGLLGMCLIPVGLAVGGFTSGSELARRMTAPLICPEGTTGRTYSYETTSYNENGVAVPATAFELHCVDASGRTVKEDPLMFAFLWEAMAAAAALVVMAALSFILAAPAGVLAAKLFGNRQRSQK